MRRQSASAGWAGESLLGHGSFPHSPTCPPFVKECTTSCRKFTLSSPPICPPYREELEVVFLGTVSSVPSKFRNVTSIYLDRFALGGMLLDCGEDTFGQLKRR